MCDIQMGCSEGYSEDYTKEPLSGSCIITIQWVTSKYMYYVYLHFGISWTFKCP